MPIEIDLTGVWMGQPGTLAPIPNAVGDLSEEGDRPSTTQTAINGARTMQIAPLTRRTWKVSAPALTPVERGTVEGLYRMGGFPWALALIGGWRHNLLTPEESMFSRGGGTIAGPVQLPPDRDARIPAMVAPNRMILGAYAFTDVGVALALPGVPVTASAWMKRWPSQVAWLSLAFRDAAGKDLSVRQVSAPAADWSRLTITGTPPPGTAWAALDVAGGEIAAPAITWTDTATDWTLGTGCHQAMPSPPSWTLDPNRVGAHWDLSMTLTELG